MPSERRAACGRPPQLERQAPLLWIPLWSHSRTLFSYQMSSEMSFFFWKGVQQRNSTPILYYFLRYLDFSYLAAFKEREDATHKKCIQTSTLSRKRRHTAEKSVMTTRDKGGGAAPPQYMKRLRGLQLTRLFRTMGAQWVSLPAFSCQPA